MKFNIVVENERDKNLKCLTIDEKFSLKSFKKGVLKGDKVCIILDESVLNLSQKLYGASKSKSILIQKENSKKLIKLYKNCKKIIKFLNRKKVDFANNFYYKGLKDKKNNNDLMLCGMLDTYFCYNPFKRLEKAVEYACDFLDKENELNNMCDFRDNHCTKDRELSKDRASGCCPNFCKYNKCTICDKKCLSCKIFMCDFLIEKGFYFTPNTIPILKLHLSPLERFVCFGLLFKPLRQTSRRLWLVRFIEFLYVLVAILAVLMIFSLI